MKTNIIGNMAACAAITLAASSAWAEDIPVECVVQSDLKVGRVYTGMMWKPSFYTDIELWDRNAIGLYGSEYAFIPVVGSGAIKPRIIYCNTPKDCLDSAQVWTEQQMFSTFTPPGVSPSRWKDNYGDDEWEYESSNACWEFSKEVWPDKKPVEGRRWIVVRGKPSSIWSGLSTFRVGILGTSEISDAVYVRPSEYALNPPIAEHIRGIDVTGVDQFAPWTWHGFASNNGVYVSEYNFYNEKQVESGKRFGFTVALPSAGTLVIAGKGKDDSPSAKESMSATGKNIVSDVVQNRSNAWGDDDFRFSDESFWKTSYAAAIRRIKVSAATTLTFKHTSKYQVETAFNRMYFFPADNKSVAIEVGYFDLDFGGDKKRGINLIHGRVTGSGVYKSGETATLRAIAGDGEEFDHWEVRFGNLTLDEAQKTSPTLSFAVTDEMCGEMEDEKQIFISAAWKPKYKVTALPSIVGAGTVTGTGSYFDGESATLSATPAQGYDFVQWSDGETEATRTVDVVAADSERVIYACFQRNGEPIDEGNAFGPFVAGEKVDVYVGLTGYKATGLPAGLSYNATTGYVTGAAKAAGEYEVTFSKQYEPDETVVFTIRAEEVSIGCEGLSSGTFVAGVAGNADGIPLQIDAETGVKSVSVAKLPAGMKYDANTGRITGAPTKSGTYTVTLSVTTASGAKQTVEIPVVVAALPEAAIGTFNGFVKAADGEENVGTFQLTATDAGKLTAKVTTASGTYTFSGTCWDSVDKGVYSATLATKKGDVLTLELDSVVGWDGTQLTGEFAAEGGAWREVEARKNAFGKTWYFNAEGDEVDGWALSYAENAKAAALAVTLNADGTTKVAGKLGNLSVSASGYADVTEIAGGVIHADFAPTVSVKEGNATVKCALSLRANLWFDRSNDHLEGAGTAQIVKE